MPSFGDRPSLAAQFDTARSEIVAIVDACSAAADTILDSAERLGELAKTLGEKDGAALARTIERLFEACTFHDITGQRAGKVNRTLDSIERDMGQDSGDRDSGADRAAVRHRATRSRQRPVDREAHLLNGPQLSHNALDQDAVDGLFGGKESG